jgi:CBS domain-containing protein/sporulation protein YlmC with PRC-barrel domain
VLYLSSYLGRPVLDAESRSVGKLTDLVARLENRYPAVVAVRIRTADKKDRYVPWADLLSFEPLRIILGRPARELAEYRLDERDVLLARNVLDKQIIDLEGHRLIRVQDIELFRVYDRVRLLGVDVSASALVRRLGLGRTADRVAKRFTPRSVAWTDIDLGTWRDPYVRLRVARSGLNRLRPADLAEIAATLPLSETRGLFSSLEQEVAADTLGPERGAELLTEMSPDDAADLLNHLSEDAVRELLSRMDPADAGSVRSLLRYEETSAGGLMTTDVLDARVDESVSETIERLRGRDDVRDPVYELFVVDDAGRLLGELPVSDLLMADPGVVMGSIMHSDPVVVEVDAAQDEVVEAFVKYNLVALPVRSEGRLVGVITVDDVIELLAPRNVRERRRFLSG